MNQGDSVFVSAKAIINEDEAIMSQGVLGFKYEERRSYIDKRTKQSYR
jgi:hypothetical protein